MMSGLSRPGMWAVMVRILPSGEFNLPSVECFAVNLVDAFDGVIVDAVEV
jgi:hypothetical protein